MNKSDLSILELTFEHGIDIIDRTLYITDDIDEDIADYMIKGLNLFSRTTGIINIVINCQGGSVSDMFAIYDMIMASPNPVHTLGIGEVCSAAALLLVAGDVRRASKHCRFMAHSVRGGVNANEELAVTKAQLDAVETSWDLWGTAMAEHTNHTKEYWLTELPNKKKELWLTAKEMIQNKHGIIDEIWPVEETNED